VAGEVEACGAVINKGLFTRNYRATPQLVHMYWFDPELKKCHHTKHLKYFLLFSGT
jgi:hypothetical protein